MNSLISRPRINNTGFLLEERYFVFCVNRLAYALVPSYPLRVTRIVT